MLGVFWTWSSSPSPSLESGNSVSKFYCPVQRHTIRYRRPSTTACPAWPSTTACPACTCTVREKIFCTGPTRAAKVGQQFLVPARKVQPNKEPFHLYSWITWATTVSSGHPSLVSLVPPTHPANAGDHVAIVGLHGGPGLVALRWGTGVIPCPSCLYLPSARKVAMAREKAAMPSLRNVAHDGCLWTFTTAAGNSFSSQLSGRKMTRLVVS